MTFFKTVLASAIGFVIANVIAAGFVVVMIIAAIASGSKSDTAPVPSSAVLKIEPGKVDEFEQYLGLGALSRHGESLTLRQYLARIEGARTDSRIKGIWLNLGNYRGSWAQAEELRSKLLEFRSSKKFVIATSDEGGMNESNYYIATAADSIVLDATSGLEMNGIAASLVFLKPMLDKLGIEAEVVRAGSYKSAVEPFIRETASPENREMTTQLVEGTFARFTAAVTQARHLTPDSLKQIIDNKSLLTPWEAKQAGLVDAVLYKDQIDSMLERHVGDHIHQKTVDVADYLPESSGDEDEEGRVAIVYLVGQIVRGDGGRNANPLFGGDSYGDKTFAEAMESARKDASVKAVVIRIDSPGGDAGASDAMWREVMLTRKLKPVIVSMGGVAASGGYYVAAAADTIVADPTTITGSIGVFGLWFTMQKLFEEKLGVHMETIKTGPNADMFSASRPPTDLERSILARHIDTTYQRFLNVVAQGRKMSVADVDQIAQGRVWTGEQARERHLVDVLGGLDSAVSIAAHRVGLKEGTYSVRILPRQRTFFEKLAEQFGSMQAAMVHRTAIDDYLDILGAMRARAGVQMRMEDITMQ
ncbi:MAG: signal peptide peptidase SppA [Bacteroidetes bacterium]|nr:signal peptide peptidase SppA [Bacteroidota bacterium]